MKKALLGLMLLAIAALGQTDSQLTPPWSVTLGGPDWSGQHCLNQYNQAGWMWGYVVKDANGTPHVKMSFCDGQTGNWLPVIWDNPAQAPQFSDAETPLGAIDGKNAAFSLAHAPATGSVPIVSLNGMIQKLNGDYTLTGAALTFGHAPAAGDALAVWYRY